MRAVGNFRTWEERDPHTQQYGPRARRDTDRTEPVAESMYPGFAAKDVRPKQKPGPNCNPRPTSQPALRNEPDRGYRTARAKPSFACPRKCIHVAGDRGNIVVQTADQGAFVVGGEGKQSDMVIAAIRKLSPSPFSSLRTPACTVNTWEEMRNWRRLAQIRAFHVLSSTCNLARRGYGQLADPVHHATLMVQNNVSDPCLGGQRFSRHGSSRQISRIEERRRRFPQRRIDRAVL
jgi:hypothetical protein